MGFQTFLGFAPFLAFALVEKLVGIVPGLATGFVVSLALVGWEAARTRSFNILEAGSAVIFGGLTLLVVSRNQTWSVWQVRLFVDAGLALVVFLSILFGRPFTLQHARTSATADARRDPAFMRHNTILSGVWGLAFVGLALIDLYMTTSGAPDRRGIVLTLGILAIAARLTQSYVRKLRRAAGDG